MKLLKKSVAYVLAFVTVFSSFTILPSEFFNMADVSAVELTTQESEVVEINQDEITVEEPATVEINNDEIAMEKTVAVKTNKDEITVAQSNAGETYTEGDFTYSIINDNEVELVSYNSTNIEVVIPDVTTGSECSELANKKVTAIGNNAFKEKDLATLTFGKNIVTIGEYAFAYNRYLRTVDLSVCTGLKTIGEYAFYENNKMNNLTFPNSLEIISPYAFYNCYCIKKLEIGTNITRLGKKSFYGCKNMSELNIKGGNHVAIEDYAFSDCSYMDKLTIGDGVEIIGKGAFEWNDWLSDITIGNTVTTIKHRAIPVNSITQMTIGTGLTTLEKEAIHCDNFYYRYGDGDTGVVEADIKINSENITTCSPNSFPQCDDIYFPYQIRLYCYKDSVTHKTLDARECGNVIKFLEPPYHVLGIKVNGAFLNDFDEQTKQYYVYGDKIDSIEPVFDRTGLTYSISKNIYYVGEGTKYTVTIYGVEDTMIDEYTIVLKDYSTVTELYPTDIKINGVSIGNFKADKKSYTYYTKDLNNINIVPEFSQADVKYEVTAKDNVYTLNIFDEDKYIVFTYKITAQDFGYTVIGDVTLMLNNIGANKVGGSVALPKGTYRLKLAKGDIEFGYSKRVKDYCSVTLSDKYKGFITLDTTGGTYTFQFDNKTNKLIIKHDENLPNEYLIGDIDTILKPVGDRPLSIGTQQLPEGTYKFKLSIGGKEYGYNKVVNDATSGSLSMNSKYTAQVTLNATGGLYTFTLNTETNKLIIRHTPTDDECTTDVHISGTFNLVLNDKSETGEDLTIATGTTYLEDGCHTFKVYNYGVAYTSGVVIKDNDKRILSSQYTTPITLNATGGNYKFVFDKETGVLQISLEQ